MSYQKKPDVPQSVSDYFSRLGKIGGPRGTHDQKVAAGKAAAKARKLKAEAAKHSLAESC